MKEPLILSLIVGLSYLLGSVLSLLFIINGYYVCELELDNKLLCNNKFEKISFKINK